MNHRVSLPFVRYPNLWEQDSDKIPLTCFDCDWSEPYSIHGNSPTKTEILCLVNVGDNFHRVGLDIWIKRFIAVRELQLQLNNYLDGSSRIFAHFGHLSFKTITSLTLTTTSNQLPSREVFEFICGFHRLEYLRIVGDFINNVDEWDAFDFKRARKRLTGTFVYEGNQHFTQNLSRWQTVFGYREIVQTRICSGNGLKNLVEVCSNTLERIRINHGSTPLNLSNAEKLKKAEFLFTKYDAMDIATTLRTIDSKKYYPKVSIHLPFEHDEVEHPEHHSIPSLNGWKDLDDALFALLELYPRRVKFVWDVDIVKKGKIKSAETKLKDCLKAFKLLPRSMAKVNFKIKIDQYNSRNDLMWFIR